MVPSSSIDHSQSASLETHRYQLGNSATGENGFPFPQDGMQPSSSIMQPQTSAPHGDIVQDSDMDKQPMVSIPTTIETPTTSVSSIENVPVRWFIDRQSSNGAWILDDQQVVQITGGKSFNSITVTGNRSRDVITTALAIAVLESKYNDQKRSWKAAVSKARKQLEREGLSYQEANALIDEIKSQI